MDRRVLRPAFAQGHQRPDSNFGEAQGLRQIRQRSGRVLTASALPLRDWKPGHFKLGIEQGVAHVVLSRPEKKNPLTFESYAELVQLFRGAASDTDVKAFVLTGEGGNFCSGGDVFEIIGPLLEK